MQVYQGRGRRRGVTEFSLPMLSRQPARQAKPTKLPRFAGDGGPPRLQSVREIASQLGHAGGPGVSEPLRQPPQRPVAPGLEELTNSRGRELLGDRPEGALPTGQSRLASPDLLDISGNQVRGPIRLPCLSRPVLAFRESPVNRLGQSDLITKIDLHSVIALLLALGRQCRGGRSSRKSEIRLLVTSRSGGSLFPGPS